MLNDPTDKNTTEESEYHFSDDDINYEMDSDSAKPAAPVIETKPNFFTQMTRSKRMMLSLVVFLVLIFVIYKMMSPATTAPSTDIITPVTQPVAATATSMSTPTKKPVTESVVTTTVQVQPAVNANSAPQAQTTMPASPAPAVTVTTKTAPVNLPPPGGQELAQVQASAPSTAGQLPAVIPVESQTYNYPQPSGPSTSGQFDGGSATTTLQTQAAVVEMETAYNQKLSQYEMQNKSLQDKVDALNAKMGLMETQFNQLIQVLTKNPPVQEAAAPVPNSDAKIPYAVQAIIPGRAWLKSNSGETLTVAEGDAIKGVGRVTKIDPYDGVVEINTGNKVVSLSYGSGG